MSARVAARPSRGGIARGAGLLTAEGHASGFRTNFVHFLQRGTQAIDIAMNRVSGCGHEQRASALRFSTQASHSSAQPSGSACTGATVAAFTVRDKTMIGGSV